MGRIRNEPLSAIAVVQGLLGLLGLLGWVDVTEELMTAVLLVAAALVGATRQVVAGPITLRDMVAAEDVFDRARKDAAEDPDA